MKKYGLFTKIVIALVLISFVGAGINSYDFDKKNVAATVNKNKIYKDELENAYQRELAYIRNMLGENIDEKQLQSFNIKPMVLRDLINDKIVDSVVEKINLHLSDEAIVKFIKNHTMFHDVDKVFDREKFVSFLGQNSISEKQYIASLKQSFLRAMLMKVFSIEGLHYNKIAAALYKDKFEERKAEVLSINYNEITTISEPNKIQLEQYYFANKKEFITPEQREVNIFFINKAIFSSIVVSEDEVQQEFVNASLGTKFTLEYLSFNSSAEAEKITNVEQFKKFDSAKLQHLDKIFKWDAPSEIQDNLDSLTVGKLSQPIEAEQECYLVLLTAKEETNAEEKAIIYKNIRNSMQEKKKFAALDKAISAIKNELDSGKNLKQIATSNNALLQLQHMEFISNQSPNMDKAVLNTILNTAVGKPTDFHENSKGDYYAVEVLSIRNEKENDFAEVKDTVKARWKTSQQIIKAKEILRTSNQNNLDITVRKEKKTFVRVENAASTQGYNNSLINNIFNLNKIDEQTSIYEQENIVVMARLKEIVAPKNDKNKIREINSQLSYLIQNSLMEEFIQHFSKVFEVKINKKHAE